MTRFTAPAAAARHACSFCPRPAVWIGDGQDGDSYCDVHKHEAPGTVSARNDEDKATR